ncbi:MAG: hypothetical protein A3B74_05465 [Candidatus Kerfeldbacteria bacterium RIFCSPHIGHO2_02_FULL_42_14]|uniref:Uncharacterized protein n=1 Tax=Candidatus Kerfeldbacteria bacterium RIFCSPHIGHO2_02_FULL_42_14 TaxID=1798540 RepID=A0A1G2AT75_9BACT|nr:MAG: hypothetical protein A3B74_05465 [Candidatus Kerfeldbacteria bacterium RIFCSPHIGHO2_02_FULL_42_14]OGY81568.1 MAG: hypothetical protein A3E60_01775 [Candidatus Kerfeldbacteria bacterium RIFCSPHIGHO2_12_FULL_42_13]OGY86278.1 MAG: hypothetical protein A3G01_00430 [Candidatus Kerfeldbacteria bacterium RIFCSPLOWO2_12_FULL_43_9]
MCIKQNGKRDKIPAFRKARKKSGRVQGRGSFCAPFLRFPHTVPPRRLWTKSIYQKSYSFGTMKSIILRSAEKQFELL